MSYDSEAYDVPSGKQGSLRIRRDEGGGVCHRAFLEPAKSDLGARCGESVEYNSSDNAKDSLQKVDKLSVAEPLFESERFASLPPKPEEPDGCNVAMGPRFSILSGARELAKIDMVWPKPKILSVKKVSLANIDTGSSVTFPLKQS